MAVHKFKYLKDLDFKKAAGLSKSVFDQMKDDFTMAEPFTISYPSEQQLVYRWMLNREAYLVNTNVDRVLKDAVAYGVSTANECSFCAEGHQMMIAASGHYQEAKLIKYLSDQPEGKIFKIAEWASKCYNPSDSLITTPPFTNEEAPEIIGTFYCFNVTNRLVNLFLGDSPVPVSKDSKILYSIMSFMATRLMMKPFVTRQIDRGKSLALVEFPQEHEYIWAQEVFTVSSAFNAVSMHLAQLEKEILPTYIIERVNAILSFWDGSLRPLRGQWLDQELDGIEEADKPLFKLAMLVMFASYSVTEKDILDFRKLYSDDKTLVDLCYWAANKVSLKMLDWMAKPFENNVLSNT